MQVLGAVQRMKYDLVMLDIVMPGMSGEEACREVRGAGFAVPIVAHTANAGATARTDLIALGFNEVLMKPYTTEQVDEVLQRFVDPPPPGGGADRVG